jgi:AraC-like DNA-binding protein
MTSEFIMLLLSLTSFRARPSHPEMCGLVLRGDITRAIQVGRSALDRAVGQDNVQIGQLLGRCLLAAGRDEDADQLFRRQALIYQEISRAHVRWFSNLDQGILQLHLNRPGRAAEALCAVADDSRAPVDLRVEAMVGAAVALHRAGECASAWKSIEAARRCAAESGGMLTRLIECVALELSALQHERDLESLNDHALHASYRTGISELSPFEQVRRRLAAVAVEFSDEAPLVAQRLRHLAELPPLQSPPTEAAAHMLKGLAWIRGQQLSGFETAQRIESALMLIARGAFTAAADIIALYTANETQARCHRHALDLHFCMFKLHLSQGRSAEALRWYRLHSQETVLALRSQAARRMLNSYLGTAHTNAVAPDDPDRNRLPLRYRRAYQYIVENLHDENLSVSQVSTHLGVTVRSLQLAFRTHLGLSPGELIRHRRMERIREELCSHAGQRDLVAVAHRWGIKSRSTLATSYRDRFAESPMQTLHGRAGTPTSGTGLA